MNFQELTLKSQCDRRINKGHLWIYSNEVDTRKTPLKAFSPGEQARVINSRGKFLGLATVNPNTLICARIFSRSPKHPLDRPLLAQRVEQALTLRRSLYQEPYYRLVFGDSDFLPGLVVDRFHQYLVVQIATAGMELVTEAMVDALQQVVKPRGILLKNDHSARKLENLPEKVEVIGEVPDQVELVENETRFLAPLHKGQKTGWFYDHKDNRTLARRWAKGKRVLDLYSYVGGWGIQALTAGAESLLCVDASEQALELAKQNAQLNGLSKHFSTLQGRTIEVLKQLIAEGREFDMVILDPPAFIKRHKDLKSGQAAYHHNNELAMGLLSPGGILVSASCSMHLSREAHMEVIRGASHRLKRSCQVLHVGGQSSDHPIQPAIAETDYLKALFVRVIN